MHFSIPEFVSEEHSLGVFFLVVAMGGGAAWLAGIAIARTWRPWWHLALYMLLLALKCASSTSPVRQQVLVAHYYLVDYAVCLGFGLLGYRVRRVRQMVTRYGWINERAGLLLAPARRPHDSGGRVKSG